ncbi:alpha-glucosidase 2 [Gluconacetobacter sacchari DSM 12717]|uniref:DUF5110 domain-containing protein n=2 Tax=Gluconacetobacter sacchari TaxID=92759 RepID=A0A7W4IBG6_9PROT|nr:TIM-barrel domain-containing protein [Gluconacetobacter sacchari]MBB2159805.1 DUF5110 domain-containing protein [Gluconacetobacter sacchari]GBQ21794.1 alpha-glucosidase 2 [Gluconacetobacter sacchari DSM 12717]
MTFRSFRAIAMTGTMLAMPAFGVAQGAAPRGNDVTIGAHGSQDNYRISTRSSELLQVARGTTIIDVSALPNGIFRIRIGRNSALPEDASWAVTPETRAQHAELRPSDDDTSLGVSTDAGRVSIDRATGAITVRDRNGATILTDVDAPYVAGKTGFRLVKKMTPGLHVFGLGDKMAPLDRRGYVWQNWNTDSYPFQERQDPLYKDIPFFIGFDKGRAYGVFMDNTWRSVFDFGVANPEEMSFGADGGAIDYYVMTGPTPKDVVKQYARLTGVPPLVPRWTFGFQQSRYSYPDDAAIRSIAKRLRHDRIPADVLWFDIDFQDRHRPFTVDTKAFPNFSGLMADLHKQNFKTVVITDLHIAAAPNQGYAPYDKGIASDVFLHNPDGSRFVGPVWPGPALFPDFTDQKAREYWGTLYNEFYVKDAIDGFWNDMNEPSVFIPIKTMPNDVVHRIDEPGFQTRTATHAEMHNVYGMENGRATYEAQIRLKPDQRPFVMMRASYAGGQRYSTTWTGDTTSSWNHMRLATPMLLSLGLSGFAYAGDNLGGFALSPPPDLLTKWLEIGMFNPIAEDHSDKGTRMQEPWVDGKAQEDIRRRYIEDRYKLLPYIYTIAEEASRTGIPMMRPLFLEFPTAAGGQVLDLQNPSEFMWGPDILVAPQVMPDTVDKYKVILPPGSWYDYWTGGLIENMDTAQATGNSGIQTAIVDDPAVAPHMLMVAPQLDTVPVYVRGGSIIPRQPLTQSTSETPKGALQLAVYTAPEMGGDLYTDDGTTFDYRKGGFFRQHFSGRSSGDRVTLTLEAPEGRYKPWWQTIDVTMFGVRTSSTPTINGAQVSKLRYDRAQRRLRFTIPYSSRATTMTVSLDR